MSLPILKHNSEILLEVAKAYEKLLEKRKSAAQNEKEAVEFQLKNIKSQFLFLLNTINKLVREEKNAK